MNQNSLPVEASIATTYTGLLSAAEKAVYGAFQTLHSLGVEDEYVATRIAIESVFELILQTAATDRRLTSGRQILKSSAGEFADIVNEELISASQQDELQASVKLTPAASLVDDVSLAFESLYGRVATDFREDGLRSSNKRKDNGVFFTPRNVADFLTQRTLSPYLKDARDSGDLSIRILDPAAGTGTFLVSALRVLRASLLEAGASSTETAGLAATRCLYGVDRDNLAAQVARACLWIEVASQALPLEELEERIVVGDSLSGPPPRSLAQPLRDGSELVPGEGVIWSQCFADVFNPTKGPPGFDVILSNPPWGAIKPTLREFFGHLDRRVSHYQGKSLRKFLETQGLLVEDGSASHLWEEYAEMTKEYARALRQECSYQYQRIEIDGRWTGGDADLYKYFLERCHQLLKDGGRAGFVLPSGFHRAEGASGIRSLYVDSGEFEFFLEFENRQRIFPIHGMYRFALTVFQSGATRGVKNVAYQLETVDQAAALLDSGSGMVEFSKKYLNHVSGSLLAFPEVRSRSEQRLLKKLHSSHPPLGSQLSSGWNVSFVRELDMTNDSDLFVDSREFDEAQASRKTDGSITQDGKHFLPVVEGRMVHQFTCSAKGYRGGEARTAKWAWLDAATTSPRPHYFVDRKEAQRLLGGAWIPRVGYCDITGHANERSVLAALIPPSAICGNKVPTCRFDDPDPRLHLVWLAVANSFVMDWLVRRRISTTLNFFHWKQVPFPRIDPDSEVGLELCDLAAALSLLPADGLVGFGDRISCQLIARPDLSDRAAMRARIDAIVASLFDLTMEEFELVLEDFPLLDRHESRSAERQRGAVGSVTKAVAISALGACREPSRTSPSALGTTAAGILTSTSAYLPSEQVRDRIKAAVLQPPETATLISEGG